MARSPAVVLSHWCALIPNLQTSSLEFYAAVERALEQRGIPAIRKPARIAWPEGGWFTARRQYLRIQRKKLVFDICAAPFGNGFFVSWWLGELPNFLVGLILVVPVIGPLLGWMFRPWTYWKMDTALMFRESVRQAVLEVLDGLTSAKGIRALSELERKPILDKFYGGQLAA
jgi:hypothetical protein